MKLKIILIGLLLTLGILFAGDKIGMTVSKSTDAWILDKGTEKTNISVDDGKVCWTADTSAKSTISVKDDKNTTVGLVDLSKNGCFTLDSKSKFYTIDKIKIGEKTVTINVTLLENTDTCLETCYSIYEVCSNEKITPEYLRWTFKNDIGTLITPKYELSERTLTNITKTTLVFVGTTTTEELQPCGSELKDICRVNVTTPIYENKTVTASQYVYSIIDKEFTGCKNIRIEAKKRWNENVDNIPVIYGVSFSEFTWWNTSYISRVCLNITNNAFGYANYSIPITVPSTPNAYARFTSNASGSETECSWWAVKNESLNRVILTCPLNVSTAICMYYNNNTVVNNTQNISTACTLGDDFGEASVDATKWVTGGTPTTSGSVLLLNSNPEYIKSQQMVCTDNCTLESYSIIPDINAGLLIGLYNWSGDTQNYTIFFRTTNPTVTSIKTNTPTTTTITWNASYNIYTIKRTPSRNEFWFSQISVANHTTNIPIINLPVFHFNGGVQSISTDWTCVHNETNSNGLNFTMSAWSSEENYSAGDTTKPFVQIIYPTNNSNVTTANINFNYTATDETALDDCWYSIDVGGANTTIVGCTNTTITLTEGNHQIYLYANDTSGNLNSTWVNYTLDTVAPNVSIISPTNTTYNTLSINLEINSSSDNNTVWYNWNGTNTTYTGAGLVTFSEGVNTLSVWANDSFNNVNTSTVVFTTDTIVPFVSIISPTNNSLFTTYNITLNFTASDAHLSNCWYSQNSTNNVSLPGCTNISFLSTEGNHNLTLYANDSYGNLNSTFINYTVQINPVVNITTPTGLELIIKNWIAVNYTAIDDNLANCTYSLDGGARTLVAGCANITLSGLLSGDHTLNITSNDTYGYSGSDLVEFTIILYNSPEGAGGGGSSGMPITNDEEYVAVNETIIVASENNETITSPLMKNTFGLPNWFIIALIIEVITFFVRNPTIRVASALLLVFLIYTYFTGGVV